MSPTQRSLALLRKQGYIAEVVEYYDHRTKRRKDLLNIADILAICLDAKPMLVQTTTSSNAAARRAKINTHGRLGIISVHFDIVVHGWYKSKRTKRWTCNINKLEAVNGSAETQTWSSSKGI